MASDGRYLAVLVAIAGLVSVRLLGDVTRFIRGDWPTFFLPMYAFLGQRLRAFDIPGWNPSQFSGMPFVADPSSGWLYLPAMLAYALLAAEPATALFIAFHIIVSAVAAYILARLIGIRPAGAFVAGVAFAFPWLAPAAAGAVLMQEVTTWLPIVLIGVELALRPSSPLRRFAGLILAGLAICQILAAWPGQAAYYALLVIGGWVLWRTVVTPPAGWSPRDRITGLLGIGGGILLIGFALNAASLLIRLDANTRSNAPGGIYTGISGWSATKIGVPLTEVVQSLAGGFSVASWQYAGAAAIALALLAPFVAARWPHLLFWLIVPSVAIILVLPEQSPLEGVAYAVLPRFELLHSHLPERILLVVPLSVALLAGAAADALCRGLQETRWQKPLSPLAIMALAAGGIALQRQGTISYGSLLAALAAFSIAMVAIVLPSVTRPALLAAALAMVVLWDPVGRMLIVGWGPGIGPPRSLHAAVEGDVTTFLYGNGAAAFLADATAENPGRYAGYDPALLPDLEAFGDLPPQAYRNHWLGPANWLLVHNWGTWFGLEDMQGYNPIHIRRYGEYIDALVGRRQEYHETNLFPEGLGSPLLDPLNLRFLVVPADAPNRADLSSLVASMPTVYRNDRVMILENTDAFPRAWLVHEAEQVEASEALRLLATGAIDPARTALLETAPPTLAPLAASTSEAVSYARLDADQIALEVTANASGLLMLSEIWDPGWSATVDGGAVATYRANFLFLALPVSEGEHSIVLRYTPPRLVLGLGISLGAVLLLCIIAVILYRRERWQRSSPEHKEPA